MIQHSGGRETEANHVIHICPICPRACCILSDHVSAPSHLESKHGRLSGPRRGRPGRSSVSSATSADRTPVGRYTERKNSRQTSIVAQVVLRLDLGPDHTRTKTGQDTTPIDQPADIALHTMPPLDFDARCIFDPFLPLLSCPSCLCFHAIIQ